MDRFVNSSGKKKSGGKKSNSAPAAADMGASGESSQPQAAGEQPAAIVAVLVSRTTDATTSSGKSSTTAPVKLAVAVRVPRKRTGPSDRIVHTLQHYVFLDDRRRFTNLDALLTRLGRVECVYVSCTESAETNKSSASKAALRRSREISDLLEKLCGVIDSRTDIMPGNDSILNAAPSCDSLSSLVRSLPKPLHQASTATEFVDRVMINLLGGEGSDRHTQYRGDRRLMTDALPKQALGLLLLRTHDASFDSSDDSGVAVDESIRGSYEVVSGTLESCLTLDRTAAECINLLPPPGGSKSGQAQSLVGGSDADNSIFGVLDKCKTKMGRRTLEVWLRQPLVDLQAILRRQDAVSMLVEDGCGRDRLRDEGLAGLTGIDLDSLTAKLASATDSGSGMQVSAKSALEIMYKMYLFTDGQLPMLIETLKEVVESAGHGEGEEASASALRDSLDGLKRVAKDMQNCKGLVEKVLDLDAAPRDFFVKAEFDENLQDLRRELDETEATVEQIHQEMDERWVEASGQRDGQVRLESGETNGLCWQFRLPSTNDQKLLQEQFDDVQVHRTLKNGVYFSTKDLRQIGTQKQELLVQYDSEQRNIVSKAMEIAVTYTPVLERASVLVAELDTLASLAYVAAYSAHGYVRPTMTDSEDDGYGIELKEARHPCVELQENVEFIPNDISLIFGESSFLLVTGPNMGGKSTYIRSLGAILTMAQIGSFVPCTSAKINVVHHILARVGAGDVQDRGISTFMAEMLEASSILQTATKRSLIIIDELGRGTSTFDGFGLATAISEYIVEQKGCMTVFATHFHELTALEEKEKCVKNCHVTAQRATDGSNGLTFLYEVKPGPCLESFGIAVGEMANLPPVVIADAKRKAKQLENFDYRKKAKISGDEAGNITDDVTNHSTAEKQSSDMNFVNDFRKIPLNSFSSQEEMMQAVRNLITSHS